MVLLTADSAVRSSDSECGWNVTRRRIRTLLALGAYEHCYLTMMLLFKNCFFNFVTRRGIQKAAAFL
jgi:hypothetical protein